MLSVLLAAVFPRCSICAEAATKHNAPNNGDPATAYACDKHAAEGRWNDLPAAEAIRWAKGQIDGMAAIMDRVKDLDEPQAASPVAIISGDDARVAKVRFVKCERRPPRSLEDVKKAMADIGPLPSALASGVGRAERFAAAHEAVLEQHAETFEKLAEADTCPCGHECSAHGSLAGSWCSVEAGGIFCACDHCHCETCKRMHKDGS